jgi:hypothetical protein
MSAREELLARIRTATAEGAAPPPVPRDYRTADHPSDLAGEELLELLVERLVDYRALVRRSSTALVAAAVVAALTERGARRVAVPVGILPAGLDRLEPGIELLGDDPLLTPAQLDGLDGVLTGCAVAVAETGTIVLDGDRGPGGGDRPAGPGPPRPGQPPDLDLRPQRDQRHRARPGRGRPRPPHPRGHRVLVAGTTSYSAIFLPWNSR